MMNTPIATYSEVRFDGSRTFVLFPDKLVVSGKVTLKSDFETTLPLSSLAPLFERSNVRNAGFIGGLYLALIGFVICTALVSGFHMSFENITVVLFLGFGITGLVLMTATYKKVEFLRFKNHGGVGVLDLARAGKDAAQLDAFIEALVKQIKTVSVAS